MIEDASVIQSALADIDVPCDIAMIQMLVLLAEFERGLISERLRKTLAHKARKGERCGQLPYGWTLAADGVHLVASAAEQAKLADLKALRKIGMSWREIADEMNRRGITTKTERQWTWQTTRKAATQERLARISFCQLESENAA